MLEKKKICLITTGHLTSNPRLVKEAIALENFGFNIHIIFTQNLNFLIPHDYIILDAHPNWKYDVLNVSKENKKTWHIRLMHRLLRIGAQLLTYLFHSNILFQKLYLNKNYYWQKRKAIATKADLYIAHNLGAVAIAVDSAHAIHAKSGFDAEDFHREEDDSAEFKNFVKTITCVEDFYLPKVNYLIAASPLIAEKYNTLYHRKVITILNVFPKTILKASNNTHKPLKLFWFSQTIGPKRGLETVLRSISSLNFDIEVHLLGNIDQAYKNELRSILPDLKLKSLFFYEPIPADQIFELCLKFDIGLAIELNTPLNRDICLTNKIFTYLQSGLAIIASDTKAQELFLKIYEKIGFLFENNNTDALSKILTTFHNDRVLLKEFQNNGFQIGQQELNWEIEQLKFIKIINQVLDGQYSD